MYIPRPPPFPAPLTGPDTDSAVHANIFSRGSQGPAPVGVGDTHGANDQDSDQAAHHPDDYEEHSQHHALDQATPTRSIITVNIKTHDKPEPHSKIISTPPGVIADGIRNNNKGSIWPWTWTWKRNIPTSSPGDATFSTISSSNTTQASQPASHTTTTNPNTTPLAIRNQSTDTATTTNPNTTTAITVAILLTAFVAGFFYFVYRYHRSIRIHRRNARQLQSSRNWGWTWAGTSYSNGGGSFKSSRGSRASRGSRRSRMGSGSSAGTASGGAGTGGGGG